MRKPTKTKFKLRYAFNGYKKGEVFDSETEIIEELVEEVEVELSPGDALERLVEKASYYYTRYGYYGRETGDEELHNLRLIIRKALRQNGRCDD